MAKTHETKSRNSFWQALILTLVVFIAGIFLGIAYEGNKLEQINELYASSEIFLMDSLALSNLADNADRRLSCEALIDTHIEFADKIYYEARLLEVYEEAGKFTDELKITHKKYDLLRTILWINLMNIPEECKQDISVIIYLYEYDTENLVKKATNRVWSGILFDLKQQVGNKIILIPIAVDSELTSLNSVLSLYNISDYPVLIIDDNLIITKVQSVDELKVYLK